MDDFEPEDLRPRKKARVGCTTMGDNDGSSTLDHVDDMRKTTKTGAKAGSGSPDDGGRRTAKRAKACSNGDQADDIVDDLDLSIGSEFLDGPNGTIDKIELIRLVTQTIKNLGFKDSAASLEKESGIVCEPPSGVTFRNAVLRARWSVAIDMLDCMEIDVNQIPKVKFMIYEQKFLELLERRELKPAFHCLREELSPLEYDTQRLHLLSSLLMLTSMEEIKEDAGWPHGSGLQSRALLLREIQSFVPTSVMVPDARLSQLMHQAWENQCQKCLYHNVSPGNIELLKDHKCTRNRIPRHIVHTLYGHLDEVWYIRFSHSGRLLASVSKDAMVCIWDVATGKRVIEAKGHTDAVCYVAWKPDDTQVLTCGSDDDHTLKLWDVRSGNCVTTFTRHKEGVTACAWCPDGKRFVSGSTDQQLLLWDACTSAVLHKWRTRASDLAITKDGRFLIVACHTHKVQMFDLETMADVASFVESASITSLSVSSTGDDILISLSSSEAHVWNTRTRQMTHKYHGHRQGRYAIRSCFGGVGEGFVVSGSEDNAIYLWHRKTQTLLETLRGHEHPVNCVAWHPSNPEIFASASDDMTVCLWGVETDESANARTDTVLEDPTAEYRAPINAANGIVVANSISL